MTAAEEEALMRDYQREIIENAALPVEIELSAVSAVAVCAMVQLAARHPGVKGGPTEREARAFVDGLLKALRRRGMRYTARVVELGDDPRHDRERPLDVH